MESRSYDLQSGLFRKHRRLTITSDYVQFEFRKQSFKRFYKLEITDVKYGRDEIQWGRYIVGIKYSIAFKNKSGEVLEIKFKSYFNLKRDYWNTYHELLKVIRAGYIKDLLEEWIRRFDKNGEVELGRIKLNPERIAVNGTGLDFEWSNLQISEHERYFVLARKNAPEFHIWIDHHAWFSELLYGLIMTLRKRALVGNILLTETI